MAKTIKLKAADNVKLSDMNEEEIRRLVQTHADKALNALPSEARVSDVNSIILESNPREVADFGVLAEWSRACFDRAHDIDDFVNPAILVVLAQSTVPPQPGKATFNDPGQTRDLERSLSSLDDP